MSGYRLFIPCLFLFGCQQWINKNPFLIPEDLPIRCAGKLCCYPTNKERNQEMCVSSDQGSNVMVYIKVVEQ